VRGRDAEKSRSARSAQAGEQSPGSLRDEALRFERLLERAERLRPGALPFDELRAVARLYRRLTSRLARLREGNEDPEAVRYLNALCVRGYALLAVDAPPERAPLPARLADVLARTAWAQGLAWLLLALGVYLGASLVSLDPRAPYALVPASLGYEATRLDRLLHSEAARQEFFAREHTPAALNALFGSSLFAHNTRVGLTALATGILAGIPTVLLAVYNGITLGAFGRIFLQPPAQVEFLAWILPHGIPELAAICLCVAGGLLFGHAIAAPGRQGRPRALRQAGEAAVLLFVVAIPLFLVAGVIESFVRQSTLGTGARLGVAGVMGSTVLGLATLTIWATRAQPQEAAWLRELVDGVEVPQSLTPRHNEAPDSDSGWEP